MDLELTNVPTLVTAATKGLGWAIAEEFAHEGARVAICARTAEAVASSTSMLREVQQDAVGFPCDVREPSSVRELVQKTVETFGGLSALVVNAGGPPVGTWELCTDEKWKEAFDLTLMSAVHLMREAEPHLRASGHGSIVLISSTSVKQPIHGLLLSNALRLAVHGLAKDLAREFAPAIRVNVVLPGRYRTDRTLQRATGYPGGIEQFIADESKDIPLGRFGDPRELAKLVVFLSSAAASYITGSTCTADGGLIATPL
ncbi:MAG: SDR family oxidoreductase [Candidatus Dormibacteria bacterium]